MVPWRCSSQSIAAWLGGDQRSESQALHRRLNRLHMTVDARTGNLESLGDRYEGLALQGAADDAHQLIGQMRKIAQSLVFDGSAFAV